MHYNIVKYAKTQSGPVSMEAQELYNLQCIVPKILTLKFEQAFTGFKMVTPELMLHLPTVSLVEQSGYDPA